MKSKLYLYIVAINILSIIGCNQDSHNLNVEQIEFIKLGHPNKKMKELTVKFPFTVSKKDNLDGWRCTGSEPYCTTYSNDSLEIRICHTYLDPKLSDLLKNEIQLREFLKQYIDESIKDDSKMRPNLISTKKSICKVVTDNQFQHMQSGYVLKWPKINLFNSNYSWANESEHLDIEFTQFSENEMDNSYLLDEINFIVNYMDGKPVRNNNQ